jgi:hypothetical protein
VWAPVTDTTKLVIISPNRNEYLSFDSLKNLVMMIEVAAMRWFLIVRKTVQNEGSRSDQCEEFPLDR